ncbi:helix-turn-helix domain-containing protein [Sphingomonas sp. HDW15A]|uniref:helix-turn-helix domain-containing protein n=1 Tax=Sphingomonas sp. HDW15A TaxID=2714942 RepID=UPI001F0FAD5B|nr:helix-turn-helix domain-containing protein [Sphingomonas sp. HDW15A]
MLAHGSLKIYSLLADGRRQITGFMFPGDFLGVSINDEYAFSAEALASSELWWFTRDAFDRFVESHPNVERELYRLAAHELAAAQAQMVLLGRKTAAERVASFFLTLLERRELVEGERLSEFDLPMGRLDVADYLGLTKETVSRMLAHLRDRNLIRLVRQDRIEVLDRDALRDMAQGFGE